MTPSAPEPHGTPPQSRPLLRVVENYRPAVAGGGRRPAPSTGQGAASSAGPRLLATLAAADRRVEALAARIASVEVDLRQLHDELVDAESVLRRQSVLLRTALVLLLPALATLAVASMTALPQLTALASAPYPLISGAVATVVATVHERVASNRLLTTLFLPVTSVLIVFASALVLRLKWRAGLRISER
jgi:hypothetical protein